MVTLLLTFHDPVSGAARELRLLARDFAAWSEALAASVHRLLTGAGDRMFVNGILAEESVRPESKVRRYKGFSSFYLDLPLHSAAADRLPYTVVQGAYTVGPRAEFLFAVLSGELDSSADVFRLALNWASSSLIVAPRRLAVSEVEASFLQALRVAEQGGATAVSWNRLALHQSISGALATIGLRGLGIGSTLTYDVIVAEPFFRTFPALLSAEVELPEPLPTWWAP